MKKQATVWGCGGTLHIQPLIPARPASPFLTWCCALLSSAPLRVTPWFLLFSFSSDNLVYSDCFGEKTGQSADPMSVPQMYCKQGDGMCHKFKGRYFQGSGSCEGSTKNGGFLSKPVHWLTDYWPNSVMYLSTCLTSVWKQSGVRSPLSSGDFSEL